jgi:hypothetical protein
VLRNDARFLTPELGDLLGYSIARSARHSIGRQ